MLDWFTATGWWILIALVVGLTLFFILQRNIGQIIRWIIPWWSQETLDGSIKPISRIIIGIAGVLIILGITAVTLSTLSIDTKPALKTVGNWFLEHGVRILIIIGITYGLYRLIRNLTPRFVGRSMKYRGKGRRARVEVTKRIDTLSRLITQIFAFLLVIVSAFTILAELDINMTAALTGFGVAGIAVGFGAQHLVRDFISGFVVLLENQYNVGDVIKVGNIAGGVEEISMRRTILRDLDGARHIIPHGEVRIVSNLTQEWSRAHFNISVAYKEDLDRVMELMRQTWEEMADDPEWASFMKVKTPWLLRVDEFGSSGIIIKMVGETEPIKQWDVMGEFRRRIKKVFDREGVEIPWPHTKVYFGNSPE